MTLVLTPELDEFIQSQIANGKYTSTNEIIIAALQLLAERERLYQGRFEQLKHSNCNWSARS